ncbi:uncharacterized protein FIBRA_09203 [Fibroporia radiculosa]|uniref:Uncharacterized protein n=1 Tax=Fibroporia radiculosa TaxID=599839 RepID=J7SCT6_9APHY|nr:uncharacterized protein FIBRA_09203 [Fibroporia radiculosa]CCM06893.1 predicted protein [Fibroporia radiculosa]
MSSSDPPTMSPNTGDPFHLTPPPLFKMSTPWNVYYLIFLGHVPPLLLDLLWAFLSMEILHLDYDGSRQPQPMYSELQNLLWALLQDIKDPGGTDEEWNSFTHKARWTNIELDLELPTRRNNLSNTNSPSSLPLLVPCPAVFTSVPNAKLMIIFRVSAGIGCVPIVGSITLVTNSVLPTMYSLDNSLVSLRNPGIYKSVVLNGN